MIHRIDFSIGPVQRFIARSRRTRDLWGSSYLLAFLSAHAMRGMKEAGGEVTRPAVETDDLFLWVSGRREGDPPDIGSLPNHFVVEVERGDAGNVARAGVRAMHEAWQGVCDAVWEKFVAQAAVVGRGTKEIWQRQTDAFWEVAWTAGPMGGQSRNRRDELPLLVRRKQWRNQDRPSEPGDKCTVMPDLQELSGFVQAAGRSETDGQKKFWSDLRDRVGLLNLRQNERLSAIALIKRLFPLVSKSALGWKLETTHWRSTVAVAATPWVRKAAIAAARQAEAYAERVQAVAPESLGPPRVPGRLPHTRLLSQLDANWLHLDCVRDERRCPMSSEDSRSEVHDALQVLQRVPTDSGALGTPPKFYALVLADGDRLGRLVGKLGGETVGPALSHFTTEVRTIVREYDGVTVYAGGDDVMAMLPSESALRCAQALSQAYRSAFRGSFGADRSTIAATLSAAVVFAHIRYPLGRVIETAHQLLDDVAKDANGRDSLVATVLKPSGKNCEWVTTWSRRPRGADGSPSTADVPAIDQLYRLKEHLGDPVGEPGISSGLLYRIRHTLSLLCGWDFWMPGQWGTPANHLDLMPFVRAEVCQSLSKRVGGEDLEQAYRFTRQIVRLLWRSRATPSRQREDEIGLDALMLARFLANPQEEEGAP